MENDDDFTFCKVGIPVDQDYNEAQKATSDLSVRDIFIKDDSADINGSTQSSGLLWKDGLPSNAASKKQAAFGSLSFNIIDTSPLKQSSKLPKQEVLVKAGNLVIDASLPKQSSELPTQDASMDAGNLVKNSQKLKKPAPRAKVPFEKGHSQMDWLKLTQTHPDLAGLKGQSNKRLIKLSEVKQQQTGDSMWTVLKGRVYNIAPYMKFHPGGVDMLMKGVGKDCTALFNKYHAWVNAEFLLEKCLVGTLDVSQ